MEIYESLVSHGVNPQKAHHLLRTVVETLGTAGLGNREALNSLSWERMEEALAVSGPAVSRHYGQKIMMLVGPTGAEKRRRLPSSPDWHVNRMSIGERC